MAKGVIVHTEAVIPSGREVPAIISYLTVGAMTDIMEGEEVVATVTAAFPICSAQANKDSLQTFAADMHQIMEVAVMDAIDKSICHQPFYQV